MATSTTHRDQLEEVIAELERARHEPEWVPQETKPRRLLRAPDDLAEARWRPSRQAIIALILIALCAVAILGVRILLTSSAPSTPTAPRSSTSATLKAAAGSSTTLPPAPAAAAATSATSAASTASGVVYVHVVGQVKQPGVVSLKAGARVADAVQAAGGLSNQADTAAINMARPVTDGEQIYVTKPGESHTPVAGQTTPTGASPAGAAGASSGTGSPVAPGATSGGSVNLNTADLAALDALPGVGPVLAQRILDWRTEHGKFSSVDELNEVSGIGDKAMERLRSKVTV